MKEKSKPVDMKRDNKTRVLKIIELLEKEHPDAKIVLNYTNPLELLVATILSAQCTDRRVNIVTKPLFKKYRKAEDYANVDLEELEEDIRPTGFYRNKARNIKKCCQILVERFNSKVPKTMKEMCAFRDSLAKLSHLKAQVVGISVNDPFSNKAFADANRLNFPLLSDYNREVVRLYGVAETDFAGLKGYTAAKRSIFIVDRKGTVRYTWVSEDPTVEPNYGEIERTLEEIG